MGLLSWAMSAGAAPPKAAVPVAQGASVPVYVGIGRPATGKEVAAWDIDVRPDFRGLPAGSGSVARGQDVWEAKCASCHGIFGESNEVFTPLVGGTDAQDVKTGRVARLAAGAFPGRTTLMKVATVSTLWDYIHRAMPWNAPRSLATDDVYAVTAYLLHLGEVLPADFTLSDRNIREVQQRLPNRDGMTTDHGLWPGAGMGNGGRPDVKATACMRNCEAESKVASLLPDSARGSHGDLGQQVRTTLRPGAMAAAGGGGTAAPAPRAEGPAAPPAPVAAMLNKHACVACHTPIDKLVGPSWKQIAGTMSALGGGRGEAMTRLQRSIREGGSGRWGSVPMPPQTLPAEDIEAIAGWLSSGARP